MKKIVTRVMTLFMAGVITCSSVNMMPVKAAAASGADREISAGTDTDTAARIEFGKSYIGSLVRDQGVYFKINTPDKKAYYSLYVKEFNLLSSSDRYSYMAVYNEYGERVAYGHRPYGPLDTEISFALEANQTYYVEVHDNCCDSNFRIMMDYREDLVGDTKDTAEKIAVNQTIKSSIDGTDDPDFYSFVAGSYKKYCLTGKNMSVKDRLTYQVFSEYDEELATGYANAGEEVSLDLPELEKGATYYVKAICSETGNYQFRIEPVRTSLKDAFAVVSVKSRVKYNGKAQKPAVSVKVDGVKLKNGVDYQVAYSNNVKAGRATVTVTGLGNYKGKVRKTFTIVK